MQPFSGDGGGGYRTLGEMPPLGRDNKKQGGTAMLLEVNHVSKEYRSGVIRTRTVHAVQDVCFEMKKGEIFGLIGGSGCGKTTITKMILGLLKPSEGSILFEGRDLTKLRKKEWKEVHRDIQVVFQHPQMTFNPRGNIRFACTEPASNYGLVKTRGERDRLAEELMEQVGLTRDQLKKYPHEISGGQAQRLSIIRALSLNPKLLICDEPTSMLDVSVQAQILSLLKSKHREQGLAMLFISHDLEVVQSFCSRVAVMNNGKIVESGAVKDVFSNPQHVYTKKLLRSYMHC